MTGLPVSTLEGGWYYRLTIEYGHANNLSNAYSSTAYWYQTPSRMSPFLRCCRWRSDCRGPILRRCLDRCGALWHCTASPWDRAVCQQPRA